MDDKVTFPYVLSEYLASIGSGAASRKSAASINQWLPEPCRISRQSVSNWSKHGSADFGIFYALLHHAPRHSAEYKFAYDALASMGILN